MNRRDFIKTGAGAFFIASSQNIFGAPASNRIRMALVGCHEKGRGFAVMKAALKNPGVEFAVVCDVDSRAMDFAADWLVKNGYPAPKKEKDFRKVIEMADVDAIVSETPDHFHAYSAVMAMRAGKAVYVEKPCAFNPGECEILLDTWKKTGKVLQIGSQRRSAPAYIQAAKEVIGQNLIGDIKWGKCWYMTTRKPIGNGKKVAVPEWLDWDLWQATAPREDFRDNIVHYKWHWFKQWGTGECGNNSVHFVDVARWMLGEEEYPVEVSSTGGKFWIPEDDDWKWPDTQMCTFKYGDGKFMTWEGLSATSQKPFMDVSTGTLMYGTKGTLFFAPWGDKAVTLLDMKGKEVKSWYNNIQDASAEMSGTDNRSGGGATDPTTPHFANFAEAIRANDPKLCNANGEVGVKSSYLALSANVAFYAGGTMKTDPKTGRPIGNAEAAKLWNREYAKGWELA